MFIFCYKRCLSAFSTQPAWRQTIPTCASTTMALALLFVKHVIGRCVCVCLIMITCKNTTLHQKF